MYQTLFSHPFVKEKNGLATRDCSTVGTVLIYLNCHMCCVCWVAFIHVGEFMPGSDLLIASSWLLLALTIITAYLITSNSHVPK